MIDARELAEFCWTHETYQLGDLTFEQLVNVLQVLADKGRLIAYSDSQGIAGYAEIWRITYAQLGRIVCRERFDVEVEDIESGPLCLLENVTIRPDCRGDKFVYTQLKEMFYQMNQDAEIFCGHARRKSLGLWKTFRNTGHCVRNLSHLLAI